MLPVSARALSEDNRLSSYLLETTRRPRDLNPQKPPVIPIPAILFESSLGYSTAYPT